MKREPATYSPDAKSNKSQLQVSENATAWSVIGHLDENTATQDEKAFRHFIQNSLGRKKPSPAVLHNIIQKIQRTS